LRFFPPFGRLLGDAEGRGGSLRCLIPGCKILVFRSPFLRFSATSGCTPWLPPPILSVLRRWPSLKRGFSFSRCPPGIKTLESPFVSEGNSFFSLLRVPSVIFVCSCSFTLPFLEPKSPSFRDPGTAPGATLKPPSVLVSLR